MGLLCGLLAVGLGVVVTGAYNIEARDGDGWRALAQRQRMRRLHVTPKRGTIYDRNHTPLAVTVEVPSVSVDAVELLRGTPEDYIPMRIQQYAKRIADALGLPVERVAKKLARRRRFAWLKRRVTSKEVSAIRALQARRQRYPVRGLIIEGEGRRFYPHRSLAAALLGFVAPDGMGKEGVELSLNRQLRGRAEEIRGLRDRAGRMIFAEGIQDEAALAGHNIVLTIDQGIQFIAERELKAALQTHEARSGSVVVVDPNTGEILAMANAPGYNPNDYNISAPAARRNRAVLDRFEPGSTLKVFAMAAALSAKTVRPSDTIYCEEGHMPIDNVVIHDTHINKWLSPTQIIQVSSNIGIAKIALGLGERKLYDGLRRFGFGDAPDLPLPAASSGTLRPRGRPWVPVETAAAAFGQGVSVTNIQMTMALAALANKGRLLEPILVKKVTDSTGTVLQEAATKVRRRVVTPRVARLLAEMMTSVTEGEGTGVEAAIPGFRVAGKTATAQKVDPATGRYNDTHYVASFMGFVPADRPRIAVSVVIDEPMAGTTAGGSVAGPVFRRIAAMTLRYLGVRPRGTRSMDLAKLARRNRPSPGASRRVATPAKPKPAPYTGRGGVRVPKLDGQPVRTAVQALVEAGLVPVVRGSGRMARSEPPTGTRVVRGSKVTLVFEPQS
jgi:cell division protein FtsI (penicillin-binding protein 3)